MFVSLAIHRPKSGAEGGLIDAMHRFRDAASGAPGLQQIHTLQAAREGVLVGLAIWDSEEAFQVARVGMRDAIADIDFSALEATGPEMYLLVDV